MDWGTISSVLYWPNLLEQSTQIRVSLDDLTKNVDINARNLTANICCVSTEAKMAKKWKVAIWLVGCVPDAFNNELTLCFICFNDKPAL